MFLRREDGNEVDLGQRPSGAVIGEMSLLTGAPRSATVRAVDGALVYEVGRRQLEPILAARPELMEALEEAMATRLRTQDKALARYDAGGRFRRWRSEELQGVGPGGVLRGSAATSSRTGGGSCSSRGNATPYCGRQHDCRRERGERQVGGGEAVAAQVGAGAAVGGDPCRRSRGRGGGPRRGL